MLSLPVIAVIFFGAGYLLQRTLIQPFIGRPEHQQFLLLLGLALVLVNVCLAVVGPDSRSVQLDSQFDSYEVGPLVLDAVRLYAAIAALVIAGLLWLFFTRTRIGKSIRAAADNNMGALVVGLDVRRLYAITFGVGAACVGAAGALMITIIPVTPFLAAEYTLLAFIIVILGGLGSMTGALLGGLLIGVSEAVAGLLVDPALKSLFSFGLLILVLLLRPQGILGKRGI
jgi:branched-chain amino acid transport system permease protein